MARVHVLTGSAAGEYRVVLHVAMPGGTNSAGETWADCWINDGRNVSVLDEGTGAGQITTAELGQITAGTLIELTGNVKVDSDASQAGVDKVCDAIIAAGLDALQAQYKWYGYTQEDV